MKIRTFKIESSNRMFFINSINNDRKIYLIMIYFFGLTACNPTLE